MLQEEPIAKSNVEVMADTTAVESVKLPPADGLAEMKDRTKRTASEIVLYADVFLNNVRTQIDHLYSAYWFKVCETFCSV